MALGVVNITGILYTLLKADLQFELMNLSNTLQTKQMVQSQELQGMSKRHENETSTLRAKFEAKDSVSSADLNGLQEEINTTTQGVTGTTTNTTQNPNSANTTQNTNTAQNANATTNPILAGQQDTKRSAESYMQEASEMNALTSKQDTEKSNLIEKNNAAEKQLEQEISGKEDRLKWISANAENVDKQKDNAVKSFAMWGK